MDNKWGGDTFLKDASKIDRQCVSKSINHEPLFSDFFKLFGHNGIPKTKDLELDGLPLEDPGQCSGLAVNAEHDLVVVLGVVGVLDDNAAVLRWVVLEGEGITALYLMMKTQYT
ncbi:hypothetical protein E2C01_041043 [Portunus trituberculatus]|uniref:Uncharacterized protein n=1 Tax=Portunus trituberculatus TaxID=210409 RepID=A0A5B7FIZ5_PORTR|nr:hypothetical protein [Portunus trituberculatus]